MKLLEFVTAPSIYHGWSTWKKLWEEIFTLGDFTPMNIKICGRCNVRKHRDIKYGYKYITLYILLKLSSLKNMKITYSDPKYYLVRSGKGLITSLGLKTIVRSKKKKSQGLSFLMSLWRIYKCLSRGLESFLIRVMCGRILNMNPLTVTFIYKYILISVWSDLMPSICTLTL